MSSKPNDSHRGDMPYHVQVLYYSGLPALNAGNKGPHAPWWRHHMETFSALLALCAGNSPVTCEFPSQRPVTWSFDVFFHLCLNKRLSKQWWGWWFEMPSHSLWRYCNDYKLLATEARVPYCHQSIAGKTVLWWLNLNVSHLILLLSLPNPLNYSWVINKFIA